MNLTPRSAAIAAALCTGVALYGCSKPEVLPEPVRSVKLMSVGAAGQSFANEYAGDVRARNEARLGFRVAGKLSARPAEVGQRVRAGQVLAQLDTSDYQLAEQAAQAQVQAATTQRDQAAADLKRFAALREQNFISGAELERRETTLKAAQAALDQAQAQNSVQRNQRGYTTLVAERAGVVVGVEGHNVVGAHDNFRAANLTPRGRSQHRPTQRSGRVVNLFASFRPSGSPYGCQAIAPRAARPARDGGPT